MRDSKLIYITITCQFSHFSQLLIENEILYMYIPMGSLFSYTMSNSERDAILRHLTKYNKYNIFTNKIKINMAINNDDIIRIIEGHLRFKPCEFSHIIELLNGLKAKKLSMKHINSILAILSRTSIKYIFAGDWEFIRAVYTKYNYIKEACSIKIQRWFRRIIFLRKFWNRIEIVSQVYLHPNSRLIKKIIQKYE